MKKTSLPLMIALLLFALPACNVFAAKMYRPGKLGKERAIASGGIKIRVPAGAESVLLPPLVIYSTRKSDNASLYRSTDIWRHNQLLALWRGHGVVSALASVEYKPMQKKDAGLCTIEEFQQKIIRYTKVPSEKEIINWAKIFFGINVSKLTEIPTDGDISWRQLESNNSYSHFFFGWAEENDELRMYMLQITWAATAGGERKDRTRAAIRSVKSAKLIPKISTEGNNQQGTYAERLNQAKRSISGLRGWYLRETKNYIFVSNQRSRTDMRRLQTDLELARNIFKRYFPPFQGKSGVGVVKLFAERNEYLNYVGKNMQWTAGVWMPAVRELVVSPVGVEVKRRIEEKYLRTVALHEGFHQYIFYACNETNPALWFNEGCAQFFENSAPKKGEAGILNKQTETILRRAAAAAPSDLRQFFKLNHAEFYAEAARTQNYALAHALCYYLLKGAPANGEKRYAAIPRRYVSALQKSRNTATALQEAIKGVDTAMLTKKFKAFWHDKRQIQRSKRYQGAF